MLRDGGLVDAEMKERDGDGVSRALASVRSKRSNLERRRWRSLSVTSTTLGMTTGISFSLSCSSSPESSSLSSASLEISTRENISDTVGQKG
jgi:hypothetical protein